MKCLLIVCIAFCSCQNKQTLKEQVSYLLSKGVKCSVADTSTAIKAKQQEIPLWIKQNIDKVSSCNIIPSEGMKIIKVGDSYTATYSIGSITFFKADKKSLGLDFDLDDKSIFYYKDSCKLKEDLRWFIKLQMVKHIQAAIQ